MNGVILAILVFYNTTNSTDISQMKVVLVSMFVYLTVLFLDTLYLDSGMLVTTLTVFDRTLLYPLLLLVSKPLTSDFIMKIFIKNIK